MRYGPEVPIVGEFAGDRLSNSGESLTLWDALGNVVFDFAYGDADPWPTQADGAGATLELTAPTATPATQLNSWFRWRDSLELGGSPGTAGTGTSEQAISETSVNRTCHAVGGTELPFDLTGDGSVTLDDLQLLLTLASSTFGDANVDGQFNTRDLVLVFQQGEYEDAVAGNSSWSSGDWNCDGDFDTSDLVVALQTGQYAANAISTTDQLRRPVVPATTIRGAAHSNPRRFADIVRRVAGADLVKQPASGVLKGNSIRPMWSISNVTGPSNEDSRNAPVSKGSGSAVRRTEHARFRFGAES